MCRRGYADRMVLAHDTCCYIDWFGPGTLDDLKDWHYLHVSQDVLPYLREHGVAERRHRRDARRQPGAHPRRVTVMPDGRRLPMSGARLAQRAARGGARRGAGLGGTIAPGSTGERPRRRSAHLTVLYPFLPPALIDDAVLDSLVRLFAGFPAFAFALDRVCWFDDEVVWLGPREPERFSALTGLAFAAFPSCPPYGGQVDEVIPHLTIGDRGGLAAMRAAGAAVLPHLPIDARAAEVTLMAGPPPGNPENSPGQWRRLASFALS